MCCSWCDRIGSTKARPGLELWLANATESQRIAMDEFSGLLDKENPGDSRSLWSTLEVILDFLGPGYARNADPYTYLKDVIDLIRYSNGGPIEKLTENRANSKTGTEVAVPPEKGREGAAGGATGPSAEAVTEPDWARNVPPEGFMWC